MIWDYIMMIETTFLILKRIWNIYILFLFFMEYLLNYISMFCPNKSFIFSLYHYTFNVGKYF